MRLQVFQVNAFASDAFAGNPALACPLADWLDDDLMQRIAAEAGLTCAFFVGGNGKYQLRWFAPKTEIKGICGHGTLAAGFVAASEFGDESEELQFSVELGELRVRPRGDQFVLDLPALVPKPISPPANLEEILGTVSDETVGALDFISVFATEQEVREFDPDPEALLELPLRAAVVTAPGDDVDFVSRWFCPRHGEGEDIGFTGSAHCSLVPYWATRLQTKQLKARQLSPRGTTMKCELHEDRVLLHSSAAKYMEGWLHL